MSENEGRAYGWDEPPIPVTEEDLASSDFVLLPEGVYRYRVEKFERGRHEGDSYFEYPCPKAMLTLSIDGGEHGTATLKKNLFLHTLRKRILCAFFTSIGQRSHDEDLRLNWNAVVYATGLCRIGIREYDTKEKLADGSFKKGKANVLKWFLPPDQESTDTAEPEPELIPF